MNAESITWKIKPGVDYVVVKTESEHVQGILYSVDESGVMVKAPVVAPGPANPDPKTWAENVESRDTILSWLIIEDIRRAD